MVIWHEIADQTRQLSSINGTMHLRLKLVTMHRDKTVILIDPETRIEGLVRMIDLSHRTMQTMHNREIRHRIHNSHNANSTMAMGNTDEVIHRSRNEMTGEVTVLRHHARTGDCMHKEQKVRMQVIMVHDQTRIR